LLGVLSGLTGHGRAAGSCGGARTCETQMANSEGGDQHHRARYVDIADILIDALDESILLGRVGCRQLDLVVKVGQEFTNTLASPEVTTMIESHDCWYWYSDGVREQCEGSQWVGT
jgi:hypothetical protein